jgi:hypothetical protein
VLVAVGSGRTADVLAAVVRGEASDARADELVATGLVQMLDPPDGPARMLEVLRGMLALGAFQPAYLPPSLTAGH